MRIWFDILILNLLFNYLNFNLLGLYAFQLGTHFFKKTSGLTNHRSFEIEEIKGRVLSLFSINRSQLKRKTQNIIYLLHRYLRRSMYLKLLLACCFGVTYHLNLMTIFKETILPEHPAMPEKQDIYANYLNI